MRWTEWRWKEWFPLAEALAVAVALVALLPVDLCDDAYITLRLAENLAQGRGMVFNPGEHHYICTNPLWCLLIAAGRFVVRDTALAATLLSAFFIVVLAIEVVRLGAETRFGARAGVLGATFLLTNPVFLLTARSGIELSLYMTLIVVTSRWLAQRRFTAATTAAAFLMWVRFDGVTLFATAVGLALFAHRAELRRRPGRLLLQLAPAAAVALAYVVFGLAVFHDVVPVSVRAKALTAPRPFSEDWAYGAFAIAREFGKTVIGRSAYWYVAATPAVVMPVLALVGVRALVSRRDPALVPLLVLTAVHVLAYVASGTGYTTNFPWYFAPVLAATSLVAGVGVAWPLERLGERWPTARIFAHATTLLWFAASMYSLREDALALQHHGNDRERLYATGAVWAGAHFGKGDVVAANEIGAIGYYLPPDVAVLDMFGLLRDKQTLGEDFVELVKRTRPSCILSRSSFAYVKAIDKQLHGSYRWVRFRMLSIGVRSDLPRELRPSNDALKSLYSSVRLDREYDWPSSPVR
jgi:hypothetical protein